MPWAVADDLKNTVGIPGETAVAARLIQAAGQIELATGLIQDTPNMKLGARDLVWLKKAVCYQYAWLQERADLYTREDVANASQDGQSATYRKDAHTLAPLAKAALRRLSWKGTRSVKVGVERRSRLLDDEGDERSGWTPL